MKTRELRFEELVGRVVCNPFGRPIGRIEELRIEPNGEEYEVVEYILGLDKRLPRILAALGQIPTFRALGIGKPPRHRPIPWQWIDLSDPERPVLSETSAETKR